RKVALYSQVVCFLEREGVVSLIFKEGKRAVSSPYHHVWITVAIDVKKSGVFKNGQGYLYKYWLAGKIRWALAGRLICKHETSGSKFFGAIAGIEKIGAAIAV